MLTQAPKTPPPAKKFANIDADQFASNQAAIPIPYLAGHGRLAITFIAPPYNALVTPVKEKTGKDQESTVGQDYSGDYACVLACVGRRHSMQAIFQVVRDSDIVWSGTIVRDTDHYEPVTVEDMGVFRVYWGDPDQPRDAVITPIGPLPAGVDPRDTTTWPNGDRTTQLP